MGQAAVPSGQAVRSTHLEEVEERQVLHELFVGSNPCHGHGRIVSELVAVGQVGRTGTVEHGIDAVAVVIRVCGVQHDGLVLLGLVSAIAGDGLHVIHQCALHSVLAEHTVIVYLGLQITADLQAGKALGMSQQLRIFGIIDGACHQCPIRHNLRIGRHVQVVLGRSLIHGADVVHRNGHFRSQSFGHCIQGLAQSQVTEQRAIHDALMAIIL